MLKRVVSFYVIFLSCCISVKSYGQDVKFSIQHYTTDNGLVQNGVYDFIFDKRGYLWIATQNGISCFDGLHFRTYNVSNSPVFKTNRFGNLYRRPGALLGVETVGINYLVKDDLSIVLDTVMAQEKKYVGQRKSTFFLKTNKFFEKTAGNLRGRLQGEEGSRNNMLFIQDGYSICYLRYNNKIYYINNDKDIVTINNLPVQDSLVYAPAGLIGDVFICLYSNKLLAFKEGLPQNNIRLSQRAKGLLQNAAKGQGFITSKDGMDPFVVTKDSIYLLNMIQDTVGIEYAFKNEFGNFREIWLLKRNPVSGQVFIGSTLQGGIFILSPTAINTLLMDSNAIVQNYNIIYDLIGMSNGDILTGASRFNIYTKKVTHDVIPFKSTTLYRCRDSSILFYKYPLLYRADKQFRNYQSLVKSEQETRAFLQSDESFIWAGLGPLLAKIYPDNKVEPILRTADDINVIFQYDKSYLWVVFNDGIYSYNIKNNRLSSRPIFENSSTRSIYRAHDSSIWVATYGFGIFRYVNGRFVSLPLDNKKVLQTTHNFYEDTNGFFWMPTNNGLVQCKKTDLDAWVKDNAARVYYYHYDTQDGLINNEFNGNSPSPYTIDSYGTLVYPNMGGAVFFKPASMRPDTSSGTILFESVLLDNHPVPTKDDLVLSPDFEQLIVGISTAYFGKKENLNLDYQIEGLSKTWFPVNDTREIVINQLPPGSYTLVIRKQNNFGIGNYTYGYFPFVVSPHFYQTGFFYLLAATGIGLFVVLFSFFQNWRIRKRKNILEREVKIRTGQLANSLERLNATVDELSVSGRMLSEANAVKEKAISIILHDIKAPVNYLNITAGFFKSTVANMDRKELEEFSMAFEEATRQVNQLLEELLQWLVSQRDDFKAKYTYFNIDTLFSEVQALYREIAAANGNRIVVRNMVPDVAIFSDRNILKLVIRNLVDNATKNTVSGTISLLFEYTASGKAQVVITDTGKGMPKNILKKIMGEENISQKISDGNRLGFELINHFVKLINGSISIISEEGEGTRIIISL